MNYRGIHLTSQLSKLLERILRRIFLPTLERVAFGSSQFAYRRGRGARDAIAFYVLSWIEAFNQGRKIGLYASDVSGAFDKVSATLLVSKLQSFGLHGNIIGVIRSWLRDRSARVIVGGQQSHVFTLNNMVFQGTVWGPYLWNAFFGDSVLAIRSTGFICVIYADDMNNFKSYDLAVSNGLIRAELLDC